MILKSVDCQIVSNTFYDVVIIGSGIAGSIVAKQLSEQGKTVLILEAGTSEGLTLEGYQNNIETFYGALKKDSNSPYPFNANALSPTDNTYDYFKEQGPLPLSGSYTRIVGGTTRHWEGKTIRMLPDDFNLRTNYGHGLDWPISYYDLMPYYRKAEYEIGVAGDTEEQKEAGAEFIAGYVLPMKKLPPSFLDGIVRKGIDRIEEVTIGKENPNTIKLKLSTFPQGRNSVPHPDYQRPGYTDNQLIKDKFIPEGVASVHPVEYGERCQGNANCVPICPVQAKYDARRTLSTIAFPEKVHLLSQAVATQVVINPENGRVTAINYKQYKNISSSEYTVGTARGRLFVLAANAVENAKLMLASNLPSTSGMMGCNLMDHPYLLSWALLPTTKIAGTLRGPQVTSGLSTFRKGDFRKEQCAFAMSIHNDGWGWSGTGATDILQDAVDNKHKYGAELRNELIARISQQLLLDFMCELPANSSNRVTVDPQYKDQLGNYHPVIHYNVPDYCKKTMAYARKLSLQIFESLGAKDYSHYDKSDPAYFEYENEGYFFRGGNHFAGTHVMGTTKNNSVVDRNLRSWDHENLYLVGGGSMPSIGSSNTTLTLAALAFLASEEMLRDLKA